MIQYLIILLDKTAVSYCHYESSKTEAGLIPLDILREGIRFAMKENLAVQFVYPSFNLPDEYLEVIESIEHINIKSCVRADEGVDVIIFDGFNNLFNFNFHMDTVYVLRISKTDLFANYVYLSSLFSKMSRMNIVLTDIDAYTEEDLRNYKIILDTWVEKLESLYNSGVFFQLNLLTDRMWLNKMNNCGAGDCNITLAPDGFFYVCPAFYYMKDGYTIGSLKDGLNIKNQQLYRIDYAPLCRHCDAYQCKRCVWLNQKMTLEVNTPSHEQCVIAHLERNASRDLMYRLKNKHPNFLKDYDIEKIDYLDPFDIKDKW